jgi:hypothetical protein
MSRDSDSAPGHEIAKATATSDKGEIGGRSDQRSGRLLAITYRFAAPSMSKKRYKQEKPYEFRTPVGAEENGNVA